MCKPSVIADDWVTKGFHLHVGRVELAVRPGHKQGMVVFRSVFSSASERAVEVAIESVQRNCLADPEVRKQWRETIDKAIGYLKGYPGELADLANGRMAELSYLKRALMHLDRS
jgi:hypothetical protein